MASKPYLLDLKSLFYNYVIETGRNLSYSMGQKLPEYPFVMADALREI